MTRLALLITLLLLLCIKITLFGQQNMLSISGTVTDKDNRTALNGVSITGIHHSYGTLSNKDGKFVLHIPASANPDSLQFSMMGYKTRHLRIDRKSGTLTCDVALELLPAELSEVVITEENPINIIKAAIASIPQNYITEGHTRKGFYRTATKKGANYIQLSEAVFDIYNYGYGKHKKERFRLERMRALKDEKESRGIELGLKPNILFDYDLVNNVEGHPVIGTSGLKQHRFVLRGIVDYEGKEAYEISFDQKPGIKEALYKGVLYILKDRLAIVSIRYGFSPRGITYARYGDWATRALLKLMDLSIRIKKEESHIQYRRSGDKWVLSGVQNNIILQFSSKRKQFDFLADVSVDFVNTVIDTVHKDPFPAEEELGNNKFIEHQEVVPDTAFWKGYTILLPDFPTEAVVAQINVANETHNLKKSAQLYLDRLHRKNEGAIDSLLSFYARKGQFSGMAMAVHRGKTVLAKGYGPAGAAGSLPGDENTAYRIGSLSKPFTALVIQQLVQEGKLNLDATVGTYLPGYIHPEIKLSQLLSHTSGIPNCTNNPAYLTTLTEKQLPLREIITRFCSDPLEFSSGGRFAYSNSGYMLLAYIAETVERKDFAHILKDRIFDPLQMKDTYLGWDTSKHNTARGYLYDRPEPAYPVVNMTGAGGITSTAHDLLLWNKALLNHTLLPDTLLQAMYQPKAAYTDWGADYGYGWMIDREQFSASKKNRIIYHPGTDLGFYSMFVKKDDTESLVLLLSNTGDFPRFDLCDLILSMSQLTN